MNKVFIDTETTGLDDQSEVIQIGVIDSNGAVLLDTLVQCNGEISPDAEQVHGISKAMLENAPTWPEVHNKLCDILSSYDLVCIYNSNFDVRLMRQTASRYDLKLPFFKTRCIMREYADKFTQGSWSKLAEIAHYDGIDTSDIQLHSAIGDCELTRRITLKLDAYNLKAEKKAESRQRLKELKLSLIPNDKIGFPYFGQTNRPKGYKTLSQLRKRDLDSYEFAGTCCSSFGDMGYLFKPKLPK